MKQLLGGILPLIIIFSCAKEKKILIRSENPFIDTVCFDYHEKDKIPYLISSCNYTFNDSISSLIDNMPIGELEAKNYWVQPFDGPLKHISYSDTIALEMIYFPIRNRFHFAKLVVKSDSLFLRFVGSIDKKSNVELDSDSINKITNIRYAKVTFKIKVKEGIPYKVFYMHTLK